MDDSEMEEEIILPCSPLYNYLNELSMIDTINEVKDSENLSGKATCNSAKISKRNIFFIFEYIWEILKRITLYILAYFSPSIKYKENFTHNILSNIMQSNILIEEDKQFLQNLDASIFIYNKNITWYECIQWLKLLFVLGLSYLGYNGTLNSSESFELNYFRQYSFISFWFRYIIVFIFSISSMLFIYHLFTYTFQKLIAFVLFKYINGVTLYLADILLNINKSIRLIQEAEIIARGFASVPFKGIAQHLELANQLPIVMPSRQYSNFRKFLFITTKDAFLLCRNSTISLIQTCPLKSELNFSSSCLALLDLKDFGIFFEYDLNNEEEYKKFLEETDNFSISSLKLMRHLLALQISEFFKYFYLIFAFDIEMQAFSLIKVLIYIFYHIYNESKNIVSKLNKTYEYYKNLEISHEFTKPEKFHKSPISNLEIYIHSMGLHLKGALSRIIEIENYLQTHSNDEFNELLKNIHNSFKEIKSEIEAHNSCFDDCLQELSKLSDTKMEINTNIPKLESNKKNIINDDKNDIKLVECNVEPVIQDEVFEAFISGSKKENDHNDDTSSFFHQNINPEINTRLIKELKNILVGKANEHSVREAKALAAKKLNASVEESSLESHEIKKPEAFSSHEKTTYKELNILSDEFENHVPLAFELDKVSDDSNSEEHCNKIKCETDILSFDNEASNKQDVFLENSENFARHLKNEDLTSALSLKDCEINSIFVNKTCDFEINNITSVERENEQENSKFNNNVPKLFGSSFAMLLAQKKNILGVSSDETFYENDSDELD